MDKCDECRRSCCCFLVCLATFGAYGPSRLLLLLLLLLALCLDWIELLFSRGVE